MKNMTRRTALAALTGTVAAVGAPAASSPREVITPELADLISSWVEARIHVDKSNDLINSVYDNAPPEPETGLYLNEVFPTYQEILGPTRYLNADDFNLFCDRVHKLWFGKGVSEKIEKGRAKGLALISERKSANWEWYVNSGLKGAEDEGDRASGFEDDIVVQLKQFPCQSVVDVHAKVIWKYELERAWGGGLSDTYLKQLASSFGEFEPLAFQYCRAL